RSWICAGCKPLFIQRLKEGASPLGGELWRYRRQLVLRHDTVLPDRCVKCNSPANGSRLRRRLYWHPPLVYLLILVNLLLYVIVVLVPHRRALIDMEICAAPRPRQIIITALCCSPIVGGVAMFVYGIAYTRGAVSALGVIVPLVGAIVGGVRAPPVAAG